MFMIWWIVGGLGTFICLAIFLLIIYDRFFYVNTTYNRIRDTGERLMAWIVPVGIADVAHSYFCMFIFTFDKTIGDLPGFLNKVANRMMTLNPNQSLKPNELEVVRWLEQYTTWKMIHSREELPNTLTDGRSVWCQKGYARKSL